MGAVVERVAASPGASFPKLVPTVAEREALYRFLENERVDWQAVLEPHYTATATRARAAGTVVRIAHDTSWFAFEGARAGLGPIRTTAGVQRQRGFAGHFSLAISEGEAAAPLGVVAVSSFVRQDSPVATTKELRKAKHRASKQRPRSEKESARWLSNIRLAEARLGPEVGCIHVMDQEADSFALIADLVSEHSRFVIRGAIDRRLHPRRQGVRVDHALAETTAEVFRSVRLAPRSKPRGHHKARTERIAKLKIRARQLTISKPETAQHSANKVAVNVVHVFEPKPPKEQQPIEWVLYTSEPIETAADLTAVVDHYRTRWLIEEMFKAVKTGCAFERRQLESYDALLRALALLVPIAWHLLALRSVSRGAGDTSASHLVDDVQMDVLRTLVPTANLAGRATARDVMLAIAQLGGHIRQNGDPGWMVLGRGYEDFTRAEAVWRAALVHGRK